MRAGKWFGVGGWILTVCAVASTAAAYDIAAKRVDLAVSGGMLGTGTVEAAWHSDFKRSETLSMTTEPSGIGRLMADVYLVPQFSLGVAVNYAAVTPSQDIRFWDDGRWHTVKKNDISILDYALAIKGRFIASDFIAVKPGIAIGGRNSFSSAPEGRESGLAINGSVELQFYFQDRYYAFLDAGFLAQPYGGVEGVAYVRGGPIGYLCLGLGI